MRTEGRQKEGTDTGRTRTKRKDGVDRRWKEQSCLCEMHQGNGEEQSRAGRNGQPEKFGVPISTSRFGQCDMMERLQMNGTDAEQVVTSTGV